MLVRAPTHRAYYPETVRQRIACFVHAREAEGEVSVGLDGADCIILDVMCLLHQFCPGGGLPSDTLEDELLSFVLSKVLAVSGVSLTDFITSGAGRPITPPVDVVLVCDVTSRITRAKTSELSDRHMEAPHNNREDAVLDQAVVEKRLEWASAMNDRAKRMVILDTVGARLSEVFSGPGEWFPDHVRVWMHGWNEDPMAPRGGRPVCYYRGGSLEVTTEAERSRAAINIGHPLNWVGTPASFGEADTCLVWWAQLFSGRRRRIVTVDTDIVAIAALLERGERAPGGHAPQAPPGSLEVELTHYSRGARTHLATVVCIPTLVSQVCYVKAIAFT